MIALIDYGAGNTASVANVLKELGCEFKITCSELSLCNADKIILPGVGEASYAVKRLNVLNLFSLLRVLRKPLLGICLGMQLLCENSKEGNVSCLGVLPTTVEKFDSHDLKIPHMGWNQVSQIKESKLFNGIADKENFYFAHSYYMPLNEFAIASCSYGIEFTAAVEKGNYYGVQFHPEKSGAAGIQVIKNFVELC